MKACGRSTTSRAPSSASATGSRSTMNGSTASVSGDGLILTNHHCVASCLAQNSTRESSLLETGFIAAGRDGELHCPVQIADVLAKLENVTERVQDATRGLDARAANERRRQTL